MKRRTLLIGAAAAAAAAIGAGIRVPPAVADAAPPTNPREAALARTLEILDSYDFELWERTNIMGFFPSDIGSIDDLKREAHLLAVHYGSRDLRDRFKMIAAIHEYLCGRFGNNIVERIRWIDETRVHPGSGFTVRTRMTRGEYMDLYMVGRFIAT